MSNLRLQLPAGATTASGEPAVGVARPLSVGGALRSALADFYEHSWRLVLLNGALSAIALLLLLAVQYLPIALALLLTMVALGPFVLALMHCAVTIVRTGDLQLADFARGLLLHWSRGLALGSLVAILVVLTVLAVGFYGGQSALAWPLAILVLYVAGIVGVVQVALWPLAVVERGSPLRALVCDSVLQCARRPGASVGLAGALLLVNVLGVAAAVLPFLMMTIAYSFLAAAHFFVPELSTEEA
jgi:hypothetical protein